MINELAHSSTRSENIYFANNELISIPVFMLCLVLNMPNII